MVKEVIGTGATIEAAREDAMKKLSAPDNVEIQYDVITYPEEKKFFGLFGGKDAKIRVFYEVSDPVFKDEEKKPKKKSKKPVTEKQKAAKKTKQKLRHKDSKNVGKRRKIATSDATEK